MDEEIVAQRGCETGSTRYLLAPPPGGAEFECSLLTPKASAFSISFHKNGAQQSYSLKAIMLVSLQIPCS